MVYRQCCYFTDIVVCFEVYRHCIGTLWIVSSYFMHYRQYCNFLDIVGYCCYFAGIARCFEICGHCRYFVDMPSDFVVYGHQSVFALGV